MTCAEFQELVALHALDALEPAERAEAEAHLAEAAHQGCIEALARARGAAAALARALPPAPADETLWRRIERRLPAAGSLPTIARAGTARRVREALAWGAAAAAALALVAVQGARMRERRALAAAAQLEAQAREQSLASCRRDVEAMRGEAEASRTALALLRSPSTRLLSLEAARPEVRAHARALIDPATLRGVVLSAQGQLDVPQGKVAELWLIRGKAAPIPAGLLRAGAEGTLTEIAPALLQQGPPDAVAISFEPGPLPSAAPTDVVLLGKYPGS